MRNLTTLIRNGEWTLYITTLREALPLLFAFDRTNYSRWGSLYYEDCLSLKDKFPTIYNEFVKGNFVVNFTTRKGSSVLMDQAFEKSYNKPAKGKSGIIGITRRKEAVAQYDIIKHEKLRLVNYLLEFCEINYDSEYDLHHESSPTITEKDEMMVNHMTNYIFERRNPFTLQETKELKNLVTEKHFTEQEINFSFECLTIGSKAYTDFVEDRLNKKSKKLFDTLSRNWKRPQKPVDSKEKDVRKETMQFCKNVNIARARKYSIHKLLSFEMCETSFFLTKNGYICKTNKSELTRELEKMVKYVPRVSCRPENLEPYVN